MSEVPDGATIEQAVLLAGRAPSLHNTQPWRWTFDGRALRLFSVANRMLPATDRAGRQLLLSCGIALGHLEAALAAAGWRTELAYLPAPSRRELLATVTFSRAHVVTAADRDRRAAIERRHTDRRPFAAPADWDDFQVVLDAVVSTDDATITVFPEDTRPELAHAARVANALRRYDSPYQAELQWWTGHHGRPLGIPVGALAGDAAQERVALARRMPTRAASSDVQPGDDTATDRATVMVFSTADDEPRTLLRCGRAVSTVVLECTVAGYATCPVTNVTEIPRSRSFIQALTGSAHRPQILLRVGSIQADPHRAPTPRLALDEILQIEDHPA